MAERYLFNPVIYDVVCARLRQGPATLEELAEATWGKYYRPLTYRKAIHVYVSRFRRELEPNRTVTKRYEYMITESLGP